MNITKVQIETLIESYKDNKASLEELDDYIEENGITDEGLSDATESFEQGWNNAMEFVFFTLGIDYR